MFWIYDGMNTVQIQWKHILHFSSSPGLAICLFWILSHLIMVLQFFFFYVALMFDIILKYFSILE